MDTKHTRNLSVGEGGATLLFVSPETSEYRCIGTAYGWNEEPVYDDDGKLTNDLTPTDEAKANARLWAAAPNLLDALQGVLRVAARATDEFDAARAAISKAIGEQA